MATINSSETNIKTSTIKTPKWDEATVFTENGVETLKAPIGYSQELFIKTKGQELSVPISQYSYLKAYKTEGVIHVEWITRVPDGSYLKDNDPSESFSGIILTQDWAGNLLSLSGKASVVDKLQALKGEIMDREAVICTTTTYCTCNVDGNGNVITCYNCHEDTQCGNPDFPGGDGSGGGSGPPHGGGGGGGNNSNNLNTMFLNKIDGSNLRPCMQTILSEIKNLSNGSVAGIIQKLSGNTPGFNWEMKDGNVSGTGDTNPPANYNSSTGTITSTFNSQAWKAATELSWARTILHESVHASLSIFFATDQQNFIKSYPQMVQDWGTMQNWNDVHHEEFARSVVTSIADALQEYGTKKGYNLPRQFYDDMSWGGLQQTNTFQNLSQTDKSRILDVIATELTGNDVQGNQKTQKGKNAGC